MKRLRPGRFWFEVVAERWRGLPAEARKVRLLSIFITGCSVLSTNIVH